MLDRLGRGWRSARDEAAARRRAIPDDLWKRTLVRYPFLQRRDAADAAELRRLTSLFLDRKEFDCTGGLKLSNVLAVSRSARASPSNWRRVRLAWRMSTAMRSRSASGLPRKPSRQASLRTSVRKAW